MSMHEDFDREHLVKQSSERSFGIAFAVLFLIIALLPLINDGSIRYWALACAAVLLGLAFLFPGLLRWPNRQWLRLGGILHRVSNFLIMALLFYLVVTPTGVMLRVFGKDMLRLKRNPSADSYWIVRTPPGPEADSMERQF